MRVNNYVVIIMLIILNKNIFHDYLMGLIIMSVLDLLLFLPRSFDLGL